MPPAPACGVIVGGFRIKNPFQREVFLVPPPVIFFFFCPYKTPKYRKPAGKGNFGSDRRFRRVIFPLSISNFVNHLLAVFGIRKISLSSDSFVYCISITPLL